MKRLGLAMLLALLGTAMGADRTKDRTALAQQIGGIRSKIDELIEIA